MNIQKSIDGMCPINQSNLMIHNNCYNLFSLLLNNDKKFLDSLIQKGFDDINYQDNNGDTYLHIAIRKSNVELVKTLIHDYKINITIANRMGHTCLHEACFAKNIEIIKEIISVSDGCVEMTYCNEFHMLPIHYCVLNNSEAGIAELLMSKKNSEMINFKDKKGSTCFHIAVFNNYYKIVYALLSKGAYIEIFDHEGNNAFHLAFMNKAYESIAEMLKFENESVSALCLTNNKNQLPFHLCDDDSIIRNITSNISDKDLEDQLSFVYNFHEQNNKFQEMNKKLRLDQAIEDIKNNPKFMNFKISPQITTFDQRPQITTFDQRPRITTFDQRPQVSDSFKVIRRLEILSKPHNLVFENGEGKDFVLTTDFNDYNMIIVAKIYNSEYKIPSEIRIVNNVSDICNREINFSKLNFEFLDGAKPGCYRLQFQGFHNYCQNNQELIATSFFVDIKICVPQIDLAKFIWNSNEEKLPWYVVKDNLKNRSNNDVKLTEEDLEYFRNEIDVDEDGTVTVLYKNFEKFANSYVFKNYPVIKKLIDKKILWCELNESMNKNKVSYIFIHNNNLTAGNYSKFSTISYKDIVNLKNPVLLNDDSTIIYNKKFFKNL